MTESGQTAVSASRTGSDGVARGGAVSIERIDWIVGLDDDPGRRNFLITQCYHDLSTGLAQALGSENANWCTFAQ